MGHDHHFLQRLDRVTTQQVEFALSLYRDAELVRFVLTRSRVAREAERVALALTDEPEGPHVIVARSGAFVTCLGAGMSPQPNPVIQRPQIDALAARFRAERAAARAPGARAESATGSLRRLMGRLFCAGPYLCREDFAALAAFQPLLDRTFVQMYLATVADLAEIRGTVDWLQLRDPARLSPRRIKQLKCYWRLAWGSGHLLTLAAMSGTQGIDAPMQAVLADTFTCSLTYGLALHLQLPLLLRGAWCAARLGPRLIESYEPRYDTAGDQLTVIDAGCALFAIGMRHARSADLVRALLAPVRGSVRGRARDDDDATRLLFDRGFDLARRSPDLVADALAEYGARQWLAATEGDAAARAADARDAIARTPEAALRAVLTCVPRPLLKGGRVLAVAAAALPWLAHARAEELYLPRALVARVRREWTPEDTFSLFPPMRPVSTIRRAPLPGRNDPCVCGSGRKYKRCCYSATGSAPRARAA